MPLRQHTNVSNTLYMTYMIVWSGQRWMSASIMMLWQFFHSSSEPDKFPKLKKTWLVGMGATICRWDSIPMSQTLCTCLIWMYEVVRGGCQPQPWSCGIISTPQVNLNPQIWGQLGQCNGMRVQPYALETAYQGLKHFVWLIWMYEVVGGGY